MNKTLRNDVNAVMAYHRDTARHAKNSLLSGKVTIYGYMNRMAEQFTQTGDYLRTLWDSDILCEDGDLRHLTDKEYFAYLEKLADQHTKEMRKAIIEYKKRFR